MQLQPNKFHFIKKLWRRERILCGSANLQLIVRLGRKAEDYTTMEEKKKRKWRKQKGRSSTDAALHHLRTRFRRCYSLPEWSSYWQANYQRAAGGRWRAQIDASLRPAHTFIAVANSPMPLHRQFLLECQRTKKWNNEGRQQHQQPSSSLNDWQTSSSIRLPIPEIINSISHQRL